MKRPLIGEEARHPAARAAAALLGGCAKTTRRLCCLAHGCRAPQPGCSELHACLTQPACWIGEQGLGAWLVCHAHETRLPFHFPNLTLQPRPLPSLPPSDALVGATPAARYLARIAPPAACP